MATEENQILEGKIWKREKKVGIVIHNKANLFTNGITQNAYFLYSCLEAAGYTCQFLCSEELPSPFAHRSLPVKQISTNPLLFDPTEFHTIITVTRGISADVYTMLKNLKIVTVCFICGNHCMVDQEEFVFDKAKLGIGSSFHGKASHTDEMWIIPSLEFSRDYFQTLRGKPAFVVPHLWSPELVRMSAPLYIKLPESSMVYNPLRTGAKLNILILEPNLNYCKNAWLPIVASEKLHQENPGLIDQVYVFNFPTHDHAYKMVETLSLGSKLRKFKRLHLPEILSHFNNEVSRPIVLCHQTNNTLNYLYYEILHYGFPLVHNSPDLGDCGYRYPDHDLSKCVDAILRAHTAHDRGIESYRNTVSTYLERVNPFNSEVQEAFDRAVSSAIARHSISS